MDPIDFLMRHPPFDRLDRGGTRRLGESIEVAYAPRDTRILRRDGARSEFLYVVRKGAVRLERDGQLLQTIEEGECFGFPSLIGRAPPTVDAVAAEDTLLYQVPEAAFASLMEQKAFAEFFLADLNERLRRAASLQPNPVGGELTVPVGRLPVSPPLRIQPDATIGDAARRMRDAGVSSLLVEGEPLGILTDRDLRSRVLAEGLGPLTRVGDVATRPVRTIAVDATLFEVLVFMLEHRLHHAPVTLEGRIVGILTDTDLLRLQVKSPLYLLKHIERLAIPADLPRYAIELTAMVEALAWGGLHATQIAPVVSRVNDALVARLLRHVESELGPPPAPYAWIVFGSEGRMEQTLVGDQDNALVFDDGAVAGRAYFDTMASRVVELLLAASFPPCPGGFMATRWCQPKAWWVRRFRQWVELPEPQALVEALNFFDFRAVHGGLSLEALDDVLTAAGGEQRFLAHLARASLGLTPPLGAFRTIKQEEGGVDLKKGGIVPIVSLARFYALEAQSRARSTLARLTAAADAGTLSREGAATLDEAFRFLVGLRLREQLRALAARKAPSHHVQLEHLAPLERQHLKDVFQAVRELQSATASRYAIDRLA